MFYQEVRQNFTTRENGRKTCARKKVNSDKNRYFAHCARGLDIIEKCLGPGLAHLTSNSPNQVLTHAARAAIQSS